MSGTDAASGRGACAICGDTRARRQHAAREMMFGFRDPFTYTECPGCGCLALADPPADLGRYYPPDYYSFRGVPRDSRLKRWLRRQWTLHLTVRRTAVGALLEAARVPRSSGIAAAAAVGLTGARRDWSILDVGSGSWGVLNFLHDAGFRRLTGADPFIDRSVEFGAGFRVLKAWLHELDGEQDLLIMSHSLEHMPDHVAALRHAHRLLRPGGVLLVRTPVAARSWQEFGADWIELDAPRHLLVHTTTSLRTLATRTGFEVERVVHDAGADELWGSLQYRQDIALTEPRSWPIDPAASPFSRRDVRRMERQVRAMNEAGESGRASFVLRRC